jgi:hypothetical protein
MNIQVKTVTKMEDFPIHTTTVGYWAEGSEGLAVYLFALSDWRFTLAVLFHEIIEWAITKAAGITTVECDIFDEAWEDDCDSGVRSLADEPGDDPACPYHRGHMWGSQFERLVIFLSGASWSEYLDECGRICSCEYNEPEQDKLIGGEWIAYSEDVERNRV